MQGVEGNRNILFTHAQEAADADDQGCDTTFLVDQNVIDLADLVVRWIINVLLVEVGHGRPNGHPGEDLSGARCHWRRLLRNGRSANANCKYDNWDDFSHVGPLLF